MYVNDRDQINHHGFLRALRINQGAGLRHVAEGICSDSEVFRVETGDRLPEKLMRDRIVARLGISGEEYEEYLRPEEFRQWEIRMYIIDHINKGDIDAVKKGIEEFDKITDKNPVQEQFLDTVKYMYFQMLGMSDEMLGAQIELTVAHTVPDVDAAFKGFHLLADQELNLILEYTHYRPYYGEEGEFEWRLAKYQAILDYIDASNMDILARAKIYPRTALHLCQWILMKGLNFENLEYALNLCTKSIELLRDAHKLYYFLELLECRENIIKHLLKYDIDGEKYKELERVKSQDIEWRSLFVELYKDYEVPVHMKNFAYFYAETDCHNAVEVIRIRRNMLKMSRLKVSDNICTEKTVERFENYVTSPSIVIIRDLFDRIGLCAEYKRARIITDDAQMLEVLNELTNHMIRWDSEASVQCIKVLEENLHMSISYNKQSINRIKNLISIRTKNTSEAENYKAVLKTLECTIAFGDILRKKDIYLTRLEWHCIYDLAFRVRGEVSIMCVKLIKDWCRERIDKEIPITELSRLEMLMGELASYYGDRRMYSESVKLSRKILKECLNNRRQTYLSSNLYNIIWNYQKQSQDNGTDFDLIYIKNILVKCILLSNIDREDKWQTFLQQKLEMINKL